MGVGSVGSGSSSARRTAVVAGAAAGRVGDGTRRDWGRPGYGYQGNYPGMAAAAIARNRVPVGTVIEVLPLGCEMSFIMEMEYYYCSGQYYQPMGSEAAPIYVAAEPYIPDAQIPDAHIPDIQIPDPHIPER